MAIVEPNWGGVEPGEWARTNLQPNLKRKAKWQPWEVRKEKYQHHDHPKQKMLFDFAAHQKAKSLEVAANKLEKPVDVPVLNWNKSLNTVAQEQQGAPRMAATSKKWKLSKTVASKQRIPLDVVAPKEKTLIHIGVPDQTKSLDMVIPQTEGNPFGLSFPISKVDNELTKRSEDQSNQPYEVFTRLKESIDKAAEEYDKMEAVETWTAVHVALRKQPSDLSFFGATESLPLALQALVEKDLLPATAEALAVSRSPSPIRPEWMTREREESIRKAMESLKKRPTSKPTTNARHSKLSTRTLHNRKMWPTVHQIRKPATWSSQEERDFQEAEVNREAQRYFGGLAMNDRYCSVLDRPQWADKVKGALGGSRAARGNNHHTQLHAEEGSLGGDQISPGSKPEWEAARFLRNLGNSSPLR